MDEKDSKFIKDLLDQIDLEIGNGNFDIAREILLKLDRRFYNLPEIRERIVRLNNRFKNIAGSLEINSSESGLLSIFEEFKRGLEQDGEPDFETHYNLGLAYKDMEFYDDAIEEFQIAYKAIAPNNDQINYFNCCKMLGYCFWCLGMMSPAVTWYRRALASAGRANEEYDEIRLYITLIEPESDDPDDLLPVKKRI
jgi:tetratricopeptide (TPR) repeat protein